MKSRNALTAIALATSLTMCSTVVLSDSSIPLDCVDPGSADITKQLACYNSELDNLSSLTQSLLAERQRLSMVLQQQTGSALVALDTKDDQIKQQLQTIKQLRLERSQLSTQLHQLKLQSREQQLLKSAEEKLVQNYTQAYLSVADKNARLTEKINSLEAALEKQEALTSKLKQRLFIAVTQAQQASDRQIQQINLLTEENTRLASDAAAATEEYKSQATILTTEVSSLRDNRDALSRQLEAADKLLAEQNETIETLKRTPIGWRARCRHATGRKQYRPTANSGA